jgi:H/ACA ribonucleoprotein complex subunit 2
MDVISHLPVLCEDHNIPYIYVKSRAELGAAGNTKRATSVVMITKTRGGKADQDVPLSGEYQETYKDLVKLVQKAGSTVLR